MENYTKKFKMTKTKFDKLYNKISELDRMQVDL